MYVWNWLADCKLNSKIDPVFRLKFHSTGKNRTDVREIYSLCNSTWQHEYKKNRSSWVRYFLFKCLETYNSQYCIRSAINSYDPTKTWALVYHPALTKANVHNMYIHTFMLSCKIAEQKIVDLHTHICTTYICTTDICMHVIIAKNCLTVTLF
jgi:hypothetical protein